jgi:hypothetical protein
MGNQIARSMRRWNDSPTNNFTTDIFGRWHGEGTSNTLPKLYWDAHPNWQYVSDIFIHDGDYLRINNVTLGYDFKEFLDAIQISQARLYIAIRNLYTFTNYIGLDPDCANQGGTNDAWARGIDVGFYPQPRTFIVGVNIKF